MAEIPAPLSAAAASLIDGLRDGMNADQAAVFDLAVCLELARRGLGPQDFYIEVNLKADIHRARAPYTAALLKSLAKHLAPQNVVAISQRTQPKP